MSTAKSSGGGSKKPPNASANPPSGKKPKSKGFIESADFKPNWLETGPLSPDMLPDPMEIESQSIADEFAALQASLQRYYGAEPIAEEDTRPAAESQTEASPDPVTETPPFVEQAQAAEPPAIAAEVDEPGEETKPDMMPAAAAEPPPSVPAVELPPPDPPEWLVQLLAEATPLTATPRIEPPARPPRREEPLAFITEEVPPLETVEVRPPAVADRPPATDDRPQTIDHKPVTTEVDAAVYEPPAGVATIEPVAEDEPVAQPVPEAIVAPVSVPAAKPARQPRPRRTLHRPSRLASALLALSLLLLAAAAFIYFVNPFTRLALATATLARPVSSPDTIAPRNASGDWCLLGDFLEDQEPLRLVDDGSQGDLLADDRVFSAQVGFAVPGAWQWQVADCANSALAYPPAPAWLDTQEPGQTATFVFDPTERADRLFFPIPYVVSALDGVETYQVVGSFQEWNPNDASARLERLNSGLYQQVRRIARSGSYEAYIIAGDTTQAIDAYGRTTEPIPFAFETISNSEYVVFLLDIDRGRASVLYRMPPLLTGLAFGNGYQLLSAALLGTALVLLALLVLRFLTLRNRRLWIEAGCPRCHEHELMRIARRSGDRWLHLMGIPAYRYRCRACTWEGRRLSERGESVSPGVSIARVEAGQ